MWSGQGSAAFFPQESYEDTGTADVYSSHPEEGGGEGEGTDMEGVWMERLSLPVETAVTSALAFDAYEERLWLGGEDVSSVPFQAVFGLIRRPTYPPVFLAVHLYELCRDD